MTNADQANSLARQLRAALSADGIDVPHSKSIELVAKTLGLADGNTASATLDQKSGPSNEVRFLRCSPILRIFDERKAREFYCDFLGFRVAFEHQFSVGMPLYMGIERAELSLHLSEHHGDASPGANMFVATAKTREFHRELSEKHYVYNCPGLEDLPWGLQMQVSDPFGNRIRFCQ